MNKPILNYHLLRYQDWMGYAFAMITFCLLVSWGIELLIKEWFRLA